MSYSKYFDLRVWSELVKFSHTVFALPFALSMLVIVSRTFSISSAQYFWILGALISARSAAMGFNRIIDREIDAKNPRTVNREIPSGKVTLLGASLFVTIASLIFFYSSYALGLHCLILSPLVLGILVAYSWTKRYTRFSHVVLGIALALAPGGVWYAITGTFSVKPLPLMAGVAFWVAGFDILYSCQDAEFDRNAGLFSIPAAYGIPRAFTLARAFHLLSIALFALFGVLNGLSAWFYGGLTLFSVVIFSQHFIISPTDLRRIDSAFFTRNGIAAFIFLLGVLLD